MPKVSVIIPTYNREEFLPRAIQSVLDQDYDDFELLVIDDASIDNTDSAVRKIQAHDKRVNYLKLPENRGVGFARDFGLRQAQGEYIAWIDSDDCWLTGKLRTQVEILDAHPQIDILFADWWNVYHGRDIRESGFSQHRALFEMLEIQSLESGIFLVLSGLPEALLMDSLIHFQTVLFRAASLLRTGGIESSLGSAEDLEFFFRAALRDAVFAFQACPVAERHKYQSGITSNRLFSWSETLRALDRCQWLARKMDRRELFLTIRKAQQRAIRNLIWEYGRCSKRSQVFLTLASSLQTGLSLRTVGFAGVALLGKPVLDWIDRRQTQGL